jgi:diguanylate cyclase (GGDEF)-like protein
MNVSLTPTSPALLMPDEVDSSRYCQGLEHLVTVLQKLSQRRPPDEVITLACRAARTLARSDGAAIILNDAGWCHYIEEDCITPLWKGRRVSSNECLSGWVMHHKRGMIIEDVSADSRVSPQAYAETFVRGLAMFPIRTLDPMGAVAIYWSRPYSPTPREVQLLRILADTTAVAMENAQVYAELEQRVRDRTHELEAEVIERRRVEEEVRQLSLTDELTGLYNRRGFLLLAEQEWKVACRAGVSAVLVYVDLDGLKTANDTYGHEIGDGLLRDAARVLKGTFRDADVVARLGGDEFAVFAVAGPLDAAVVRARLESRCAELNLQPGRTVPLQMSIGVVPCEPGATLEQLLARGDAAMYREKRARKSQRAGRIGDRFDAPVADTAGWL